MQKTYIPQEIFHDKIRDAGGLIIPGNRGIGRGPLALVSETGRVEVMATSVKIKPFREMDDGDALVHKLTAKQLKAHLRKLYDNICDGDNVTIIIWNPNEPVREDTEETDIHTGESPLG